MVAFLFIVFLAFLILGLDVGFSMILSSYLGILVKTSRHVNATIIPLRMAGGVDSFLLVAIPLFVLAGELMNQGGLTKRLVNFSLSVVGQFKGSLSQVAVITNIIMGGCSGSAVADASATGSILIPAMKEEGYEVEYAGAVIASSAAIGAINPPSIPMVIYGAISNVSIAKLFLSGVIPGFLLGVGFIVTCRIVAGRRNYPRRSRANWRAIAAAFLGALWALFMPVIILSGVVFGIVTATEAASVAVVYTLLVGLLIHRELNLRKLIEIFYKAGVTSGVIMFLLAAAGIFGWLLAESQINLVISNFLFSISHNPWVILLLINIFLLILGCLLEPLPALIIFVPALIPLGAKLGIDPVHMGLVMVLNLMIGMLLPPVGFLLLVVSAIGNIPMGSLIRQVFPFLLIALGVLFASTFYPPIATWLPSLIK
jgi:TRAP-type transport system large permease protein